MALTVQPEVGVREEWTVSQSHYNDLIQQSGMTTEYVETGLGRVGIVLNYSQDRPESVVPTPEFQVLPTPHLISQDDVASLYYCENGLVPHHMWVVLNREVDDFSEVKVDEYLHMRKVANWVSKTLQGKFSLFDVVVAHWNKRQFGHPENRFVIEIIPPNVESKTALNLYDKYQSHKWVMGREHFSHQPPLIEDAEIQRDVAAWRDSLPMTLEFSTNPQPDEMSSWSRTQTHLNEGAALLVNDIFQRFCLQSAVVQRDIYYSEFSFEDVKSDHVGCAFCIKKVIDNQLIVELKQLYVLLNYKPASDAHFLIVPKRHVYDSSDLLIEEQRDMYTAAQHVTRVIQEEFGRTDIAMYFQDGMTVGQTVRHAHMHVVLKTNPLHLLFRSVNYDYEKTLNSQELDKLKERYIQKF